MVAIAVIVVLAGAGCGGQGSDDAPPGGRHALDGRTFVSESVTVAGAPHELAGSQPIRLSFVDGRVAANPGCNSLGGAYELHRDRLQIDDLAMTEMACEDTALMDQDTWFAGLLGSSPTLALGSGRLTLTSGDTAIVFVDAP